MNQAGGFLNTPLSSLIASRTTYFGGALAASNDSRLPLAPALRHLAGALPGGGGARQVAAVEAERRADAEDLLALQAGHRRRLHDAGARRVRAAARSRFAPLRVVALRTDRRRRPRPRSGMFDFTGKAKHAAWMSRVGLSQNDAKAQYIAFVEELEGKK